MQFQTVAIRGSNVHYAEEGSGAVVVLLHGFPEFWYSWREQFPALAESGFRAVAPDLRGYGRSSKPAGLDAYRVVEIAAEIEAFIEELAPGGKVALVGHDWGAMIAWSVAMRRPDLLSRLAILAVPHPSTFRIIMRRPKDAVKFWYQAFFNIPWLPELMLRRSNYRMLRRAMKGLSKRRHALTPEVLSVYEEAWSEPGALRAMLAYYRALWRRKRDFPRGDAKIVRVPTLLMHGDQDAIFPHDVFATSARWIPDLRLEVIPGGGHFVQHDNPEAVNRLLLEFLRG